MAQIVKMVLYFLLKIKVMYSQNGEDKIVKKYFDNVQLKTNIELPLRCVLEIGANDGSTLSNSRLLIENGWEAVLLEPSSAYQKLTEFHSNADTFDDIPIDIKTPRRNGSLVRLYNYGIGEKTEKVNFYESGSILRSGDTNLVSSIQPDQRWQEETSFVKKQVQLYHFEDFLKKFNLEFFDFISIDAEGMDWIILQQIDLEYHCTSCVCVEWNGDNNLLKLFTEYCNGYGLKEIHRNAENLIFARDLEL